MPTPKLLSILAILATVALGSPAFAHRVTVFAWVEGDTVHTQSQFSRERKVHEGRIEVFDAATGERFVVGVTDDQGEFSFPVPEAARARGSDLRVALKAGQGHAGEWTVPASEYMAQARPQQAKSKPSDVPASTSASKDAAAPIADVQPEASSSALNSDTPAEPGQPGDPAALSWARDAQDLEQAIERAVDRALERRLAPVTRMLAEQAQAGPSLTDIVGGMGWLVGLAGIGAWLSTRKQK